MTRAARTESKPRPIPGRIGGVLRVVQVLVAHARYFAATVAARVELPQFAPVAAVFGTYELPVILRRLERGIQRALALQRYLLDRAARGRNLRFAWKPRQDLLPHHRPPPRLAPAPAAAPKRQPAHARRIAGDPDANHLPTPEELDAWVRRRPVGRTMADICMDLGLVPCLCDGLFWNKVEKVLRLYGGSIYRMYLVRWERERTFQHERDKRPETWHIKWREASRPLLRDVIGCLFGETPPTPGGLVTGPPAIAPS